MSEYQTTRHGEQELDARTNRHLAISDAALALCRRIHPQPCDLPCDACFQEVQWRKTVRDIYDEMHFGQVNIFTGSKLAQRVIDMIEKRHPGFFVEARPIGTHPGR